MKRPSSYSKEFNRCVAFHGHVCPGLALGFRAARVLMERLGVRRAADEELVAIVENDACGTDAIQVMTGCTFGKGNFIFRQHGKQAFILVARKRTMALRVCVRPDVLRPDPDHLSLSDKVQNGTASPEEEGRFRQLQQGRTQKILNMASESLFKIEEVSNDIPPAARVIRSGTCDICGEPTKIDLLREIDGRNLCIPCSQG
ncbi:MAG: formylmethanofuran dehydrogenase [Proteobacteria bacterium]|nr:formylmethanofuran dehydrogenase [Pseudomonadota bacterium]NIS68620.1 formylmethanofuran dehydrogenase [Pseudomonadota bacterium]